jgi:hypothetical protein
MSVSCHMTAPTKQCCYDTFLLTVKPVINLSDRRRLNYQQSDSERETHKERSRLSQEKRREEMLDTQIKNKIKYS